MAKVLLVEDDVKLAELTAKFLIHNGFEVVQLHNGINAIKAIEAEKPDILILDIMLPGLDGFSICKAARGDFKGPVLFLTAKDSDFDHVKGLEIGADDYIIKPVEPYVLLARLNALLRRTQNDEVQSDSITLGELQIDKSDRKVYLAGDEVELTSYEFDLLKTLAGHAGETLSRDYIYKHVVGREYDGLDRSVDVRISRLRKKLGDNLEQPARLITVWGKGYLCSKSAWG
ncbi:MULTISPECIES: response regulator [Pseudoalteromonas]|jgi:two-component system OmpR family response regulator/two-component system response regulator RstA|uniref:response regulator n=1 Tax=Pseudoalteromonas TaxID=53246 RepID=UPI00029B1E52|nr:MULTISPECIES: response regulator [Pseudoalteromonas]AUJ72319.1 Transcriptional regulatory protein RstA [Pseudoalteromonas sp. NC201]MBR8843081.1 response regulator [Pseudoalteromonas sp. JC3]MCF2828562.1 response regulator [Pseudoalteromonas sp. OF5H-5]MCF2832725.1 response regulator [Pseudoalteromonas sp. DL2-H6]MCF2924834.1 response regulator [Pseudoalteromonas sp. DL2-H1]